MRKSVDDTALEPTFWRTCRVLEGGKRLLCLQTVLDMPGLDVSSVADAAGIRVDEASRALRALQSRGLLTGEPVGRYVCYFPLANKSVRAAVGLLMALKRMVEQDEVSGEEMKRQLKAFRHTRRLKIMKLLAKRPQSFEEIEFQTGISEIALYRHLRLLTDLGHVRKDKHGAMFCLTTPPHKVGQMLRKAFFAL